MKKISLFAAVVLTGVLITFTSTANSTTLSATNDIVIEIVDLNTISPDGGDVLAPKCGSETSETKKTTKEGKCGEGKCDDGKTKVSKANTTTTTATAKDTKSTDAGKCGEGKCGDAKTTESKTTTTTTSKAKKTTSEGKCGTD